MRQKRDFWAGANRNCKSEKQMMAKNILMGSYGKGRPNKETGEIDPLPVSTYCFNGKKSETSYFFLGLCKLLEVKIDEVFLFLTKESKDAFEGRIRKEAEEAGVGVQIFEIPSAGTIEEVWRGFDVITETFENLASEGNNIYLDITNGFRHLPLISFVSLLYLESANRLSVKGAYYGAFDAKLPEVQDTQVFDLSSLLKIVRGSFAVEQFEKTGNLTPLRNFIFNIIKDNSENPFKEADFEKLSKSISYGLPIETGELAYKLNKYLQDLPKTKVNALDRLLGKVGDKLKTIEIENFKIANKKSFELHIGELERELNFIEWQLNTDSYDRVFLLLREWIVSRCIFAKENNRNKALWLQEGKDKKNLENRERTVIEMLLNKLAHSEDVRSKRIKKEDSILPSWIELTKSRNEYAHAGFREEPVSVDMGKNAKKYFDLCKAHLKDDAFWKLTEPESKNGTETVLITPMGASVGLLYSA
ncbi:CRISPR-associated DxTHG motif protein, partial [bacterium]|nr:CRISPR-associated DxTHG motif protein [bacterium]